MEELSLKIICLPGLRNSVADALNRLPDAVGYPNDIDIGVYDSEPHALQDPIVFTAVKS